MRNLALVAVLALSACEDKGGAYVHGGKVAASIGCETGAFDASIGLEKNEAAWRLPEPGNEYEDFFNSGFLNSYGPAYSSCYDDQIDEMGG